MTALELHIKLDQSLQKVNSNFKQIILAQEKDLILNESVLNFIESRSNPKTNVKREGFEGSQKRIDDIRGLKRTSSITTLYKGQDDEQYVFLPADYYKLVDATVDLEYDCKGLEFNTDTATTIKDWIIPIPKSTNYAGSTPFTITITIAGTATVVFNGVDYTPFITANTSLGLATFTDADYFSYVQLVMEKVREKCLKAGIDAQIFYQSSPDNSKFYDANLASNTNYVNKCLILRLTNNAASVTVSPTTGSFTVAATTVAVKQLNGTITANRTNVSTDLRSTDEIGDIKNGYYDSKNRQHGPIVLQEDGKLVIIRDNTFAITKVNINYLKIPKIVSIALDQVSEINAWDEVIAIATKKLEARLHDPAYNIMNNENLSVE